MTSRDFVYWLQGFFEVANPVNIDQTQLEIIKKHISLVFIHEIDPSAGNFEHQNLLNSMHSNSLDNDDVKYRC